jgi:hypothetical protein
MAVPQGGNPWSAQPVLSDTGGSAFTSRGGFVTAGLDDFLLQTRSTRDFRLLYRYRPIVLSLAQATGIPD